MVWSAAAIQNLYELAMAIGESLDIETMLTKSMATLLRVVSCPAGSVHFHEQDEEGLMGFRQVFAIPRRMQEMTEYQQAIAPLLRPRSGEAFQAWRRELPLRHEVEPGRFFHVLELADLGVLVLLRNGRDLEPRTVKALTPMLAKLANACRACLHNDELIRHRNNLQETLKELVEQRTIELEEAKHAAELLARTDSLTQLNNRRAFYEASAVEMARARRYSRPLSVVMFDVDHFKRINDTHGHAAGDEVIRTIAQVLCREARATDVIARIGGEEFALILPETDDAAAILVAERIRAALMATVVRYHETPFSLTASFGVATHGDSHETFDTLMNRADRALYRAKSQGRNQTCAADELTRGA